MPMVPLHFVCFVTYTASSSTDPKSVEALAGYIFWCRVLLLQTASQPLQPLPLTILLVFEGRPLLSHTDHFARMIA